jgi:integrase/recombinase XerD
VKQSPEKLSVLLHEPEGPLVPYLDTFARLLHEQGFPQHLLGRQIRVVAKFSQWLLAEAINAPEVSDEHVQQFFAGGVRRRSIHNGEFATLGRLLGFLRQVGVIAPLRECAAITPLQTVVGEFATYLRQERGLSEKTLIQYCPFIVRFLSERFAHEPIDLAALEAADVIGFITRQATQLSAARAKAATTALRSFLRYVRYCGATQRDLVAAVPTVPNWSMTGIPRAITAEHIHAVLAHCPRDTPGGRRDFAILMLLVHLGLRSGEIVSLTLDSIDWEAGSIAVVGKGQHSARLPLPVSVGEAITDYLRYGRPASRSRALFLRTCAPLRGLGASQSVGTIVRAALTRAGIDTGSRGSHQFRHALATDLLRHGASLSEIGSVLRHHQAKTTSIYAKVDFAALRPLSLPWPGGVQ